MTGKGKLVPEKARSCSWDLKQISDRSRGKKLKSTVAGRLLVQSQDSGP